jgi:putative N6-adenine-specific DNA methylase
MGQFPASSFTELFDGVKALPWENWIGRDDAFPVTGHSIRSALTSIPDCQSIVKKAVVDRLSSEYGVSWFCEEGSKYRVEFFIMNDVATLMIDTSGAPLYKRGYRTEAGGAPLRETLACAVAKVSRPREGILFWDPFCGSGTIPIEAALMMTNTAPGLNREFAAEDFYDIDPRVWKEARDEAKSLIKTDTAFEAYASDIDPKMIEITRQNLKRSGMEGHVKTFVKDALTVGKGGMKGSIICNPPYGERLLNPFQARKLYADMGQAFSKLNGWQIYILTAADGFERAYGKKADKIRKLYNGMLKCNLYQYYKPEKKE